MKSYAFGDHVTTRPVAPVTDPTVLWRAVAATLRTWAFRIESRRELAELDPLLLADLGLDPVQALAESRKPFWRA